MEQGTPKRDELADEYQCALRRYLRRGGEAALQSAYELGRRGMGEGRGVLSMIALHHHAMAVVLSTRRTPVALSLESIERGGNFLAESMSPFEMTHRAFGDAIAALRHMNEVLEEEVKRIAHALHDDSCQLLAAVHLSLDQLEREVFPAGRKRLREVKGLLDEVDQQMRRLSHELRPTLLDDLGLAPAIEFLSEGIARRSGLRVSIRFSGGKRLPAPLETVLYRVVQEALNNVVKHARASSVKIELRNSAKSVSCSIADDGVGFDPHSVRDGPNERGFGLLGMNEKLQPLGGTVKIQSAPGHGTKLLITVPRED